MMHEVRKITIILQGMAHGDGGEDIGDSPRVIGCLDVDCDMPLLFPQGSMMYVIIQGKAANGVMANLFPLSIPFTGGVTGRSVDQIKGVT